jgi:hypothetical protein
MVSYNAFEIEQLVLPIQCRKPVLDLVHNIPMAGHMGKNKTARRVPEIFYCQRSTKMWLITADHVRNVYRVCNLL